MSTTLSMAAFALAASISPGPVNIVAVSSGAQHGLRASMAHVTGATVGFTVLLVLIGLGLHELTTWLPWLVTAIQWAGVAFLLFMAWKLATDDGRLGDGGASKRPSLLYGAAMQWLNPKAWLAAIAGMGAYAAGGDVAQVGEFGAIYFVICYASIACWAYAGAFLRHYLQDARRMRWLNRGLAALLVASAVYLLVG